MPARVLNWSPDNDGSVIIETTPSPGQLSYACFFVSFLLVKSIPDVWLLKMNLEVTGSLNLFFLPSVATLNKHPFSVFILLCFTITCLIGLLRIGI